MIMCIKHWLVHGQFAVTSYTFAHVREAVAARINKTVTTFTCLQVTMFLIETRFPTYMTVSIYRYVTGM